MLVLVACARPDADCTAVGSAYQRVIDDGLPSDHQEMKRPQHEVDESDAAYRVIEAERQRTIVRQCQTGAWSADVRNCARGASSGSGVLACFDALPPYDRGLLEDMLAPASH